MYIFNGCINHSAGTTGNGIECRFKKCAENRRRYLAPIKLRSPYKKFANVLRKRRNISFCRIAKQSAVCIRKYLKLTFKICVAFFQRCIKRYKKALNIATKTPRIARFDKTAETVFRKYFGIFGIKAKDKANAKTIESGKGLCVGISILL